MIDRIQSAEMTASDRMEELQARALEYGQTATARLAEVNAFVKDYTEKQPARALGIALGVGVFLGWMIKRR